MMRGTHILVAQGQRIRIGDCFEDHQAKKTIEFMIKLCIVHRDGMLKCVGRFRNLSEGLGQELTLLPTKDYQTNR